jgi:hypothetical protein
MSPKTETKAALADKLAKAYVAMGAVPKEGHTRKSEGALYDHDYHTLEQLHDHCREHLAAEGVATYPSEELVETLETGVSRSGVAQWTAIVKATLELHDVESGETLELPISALGASTASFLGNAVQQAKTQAWKTLFKELFGAAEGEDPEQEAARNEAGAKEDTSNAERAQLKTRLAALNGPRLQAAGVAQGDRAAIRAFLEREYAGADLDDLDTLRRLIAETEAQAADWTPETTTTTTKETE